MRGWKKIFHANGNDKMRVAIPISDKIDFKTKAITKDNKRASYNDKGIDTRRGYYSHYIYAPNKGAPKYIKQIYSKFIKQIYKDIKGEIDNNIIIVGDSNTPLT